MQLIRATIITFSIGLFANRCIQSHRLKTATTNDVQQMSDDQKTVSLSLRMKPMPPS